MAVSSTPIVARIARVLAAQRASANAHGGEESAAEAVEADWALYRDDALEILKTLREPDEAMAGAGNVVNWQSMIAAALRAAAGECGGPAPGAPRNMAETEPKG
jgi:hypothetical protein